MGCLRRWFVIAACAAFVSACGGDDGPSSKNDGEGECSSNADCNGGVCDLSTNTCQSTGGTNNGGTNNGGTNNGSTNNGNTNNGSTNNGNTNNGNTNNGTTNNGTTNNGMGMCGDGVLDAGETCDFAIPGGAGACPIDDTDCPAPAECQAVSVVGDASDCTAECQVEPITACVDGDGCCAPGCDVTNDSDCTATQGQACASDDECPATAVGEGFCFTEADWRWPEGYCTGACTSNADCGAGAVCNGRVCVASCTGDGDCRTGYTCQDHFGTGDMMCAPAPGTASAPGGTCTTEDDCLGALFGAICFSDADFPDGYCTAACAVEADCPAGSHCATLSNGSQACLPDCTSNNECRTGYECYAWFGDATGTCGPVASGAGEVGDACDQLQDCGGGQVGSCLETPDWDAGYCTQVCDTFNTCPSGSHCGFIDGATQSGICVSSCTVDGDCRTNYACVDRDEDGNSECAPSGSGAGDVGEACTGVFECAGELDAFCVQEDSGWRAGYCSLVCETDQDCGNGGHCSAIDPVTGEGICLADCAVDGDCRNDGYGCYDWDGDAVTECAPSATGAGVAGDMCEGTWDCAGGVDGFCLTDDIGWPDGYCAIDGCSSDADCGGGHCGFINPNTGEGTCLDGCSADADCRTGYACYNPDQDGADECLPEGNGPVGTACLGFWDCSGRDNALCITEDPETGYFPGGYCIQDCNPQSGNTCPTGSACVNVEIGVNYCLDECSGTGDCRPGYTCAPLDGHMVCLG